MAAEQMGATQGTATKPRMSPDELVAFFTEEAQHHAIHHDQTKAAESALIALRKNDKRSSGTNANKNRELKLADHCVNCNRDGHTKAECWSTGGGKEGQGPKQRVPKKHENAQTSATASYEKSDEDDLFAFTSTLTYSALTDTLSMPKSRFGACIDSGAS